jgi:hypothetical protein
MLKFDEIKKDMRIMVSLVRGKYLHDKRLEKNFYSANLKSF